MLRNPACYTIHLVTNPTILPTQICNITNHVTHPNMFLSPLPTLLPTKNPTQPLIHTNVLPIQACHQSHYVIHPIVSPVPLCYLHHPVTYISLCYPIHLNMLPTTPCYLLSPILLNPPCYPLQYVTQLTCYSYHDVTHINMMNLMHPFL